MNSIHSVKDVTIQWVMITMNKQQWLKDKKIWLQKQFIEDNKAIYDEYVNLQYVEYENR